MALQGKVKILLAHIKAEKEGKEMKGGDIFKIVLLAAMSTLHQVMNFGGGRYQSRTPQIPHHKGRRAHHHPSIPNGKWVMKYHR